MCLGHAGSGVSVLRGPRNGENAPSSWGGGSLCETPNMSAPWSWNFQPPNVLFTSSSVYSIALLEKPE